MPARVNLCIPTLYDYLWIAERMREDEREQFCAFTGMMQYDANVAARAYVNTPGVAYALADGRGLAFAIGGFEPVRPGVYATWGIGTPEGWANYGWAITRECRRRFKAYFASDAHRIELTALASRTQAHDWYERGLGMRREGVHTHYAADGSDAITFAATREN